jgi:hypothetical protein
MPIWLVSPITLLYANVAGKGRFSGVVDIVIYAKFYFLLCYCIMQIWLAVCGAKLRAVYRSAMSVDK